MSEITLMDSQGHLLDKLYQWDSHVVIYISGFPVDPLPTLHFAQQCSETALIVTPTVDNNKLVATIPDALLQNDSPITVYIYVPFVSGGETGYRTMEVITLTVVGRQRPTDYSSTDITVNPLTITANGTYTAPLGEAFSPVEVEVPANIDPVNDIGKVIGSDGRPSAQTSLGIFANGTYDTTGNNEVVANVPNEYALSDVDVKTKVADQSTWNTDNTVLYEGFTVSYSVTTSNSDKTQWSTLQTILYTGTTSVSDGVTNGHVYRFNDNAWTDLGNAVTRYHVYQYQDTAPIGWVDLGESDVGKIVYRDTTENTTYLKSQIDNSASPFTSNGEYDTSEYGKIVVNVYQGNVSAADNGKVVVDSNLVSQTSKTITANGSHDTTTNNIVTVNVPKSSFPVNVTFESEGTELYSTSVSEGGTAVYGGTTPVASDPTTYEFSGWAPKAIFDSNGNPTNITSDITYEAQFKYRNLITDSWETISERSLAGTASQFYAVGDYKPVTVAGIIGNTPINMVLNAVIIDFDHNNNNSTSSYNEGAGISFGLLGIGNGADRQNVCITDANYNETNSGGSFSMMFTIIHAGIRPFGGWKGSDIRYDVLGSTDIAPSNYGSAPDNTRQGYDASVSCATSPVSNTLMSCLPSELRAKMKPIKKFTNNKGINNGDVWNNVTSSIDYLPLLSAYEITGSDGGYVYESEVARQTQYTFFINNSCALKNNRDITQYAAYWTRSPVKEIYPYSTSPTTEWVAVSGASQTPGSLYPDLAIRSLGIIPVFLI